MDGQARLSTVARHVESVPSHVKHVLVRQPVKNTITPQNDEVVELWLHRELTDLGLGYNHVFLASVFGPLCFNVAESTRDTQSAWEHAVWPQHNLLLHRTVPIYLNLLYALGLVNLSTVLHDSCLLILLVGSMVSREQK